MSSLRVTIGIIYIAIALIARGIWVETSSPAASHFAPDASPTTAISDFVDPDGRPLDWSESRRMDRYGNPIETAIGDYRVDPRGEMYERHSPETAVTRLAVPST
jgi:hypothetical protein